MSEKKSLGIFWDIENIRIPALKSPSGVAKQIRDFIAGRHPECGFAKEFFIACDIRRFDAHITEGLNRNGVVIAHVDGCAKNAADDKLQELMDMFVDKFGSDSVIVVITSDINFAKPIRNARRKDSVVVLIHDLNCSQELRHLVNESYIFEDIIKNVENVAKDVNPLMSVYLKVSDLPKDKPNEQIVKRFSQLTANCGGKVETVVSGQALIRFGCKDDAQRCQQRISGDNCFGQKFVLQLIESSNPPALQTPVDNNSQPSLGKGFIKNNPKLLNQKSFVEKSNLNSNKMKNQSKSQTNLTQIAVNSGNNHNNNDSTDSNDCKLVIKGLFTKADENVVQTVKEIIIKWKDIKIAPNFVKHVDRHNQKGSGGGKATLFVTATSVQTCDALIAGSHKHSKQLDGVKWFKYTPKALLKVTEPPVPNIVSGETHKSKRARSRSRARSQLAANNTSKPPETPLIVDNMSVIKGIETKCDENVGKKVRKVVKKWKDNSINANFIVDVSRDNKFSGRDGNALLFIKATSAEASAALISGAKKYLTLSSGIIWSEYIPKHKKSSESDHPSDDSVSNLVSNPCLPLDLTQGVDSQPLPKPDIPVSDDLKSVIIGLETKKGQKVAKIVRKVVFEWNDKKVQPNFIASVERFPDFPDEDGKPPLLVTATSADKCIALVDGAIEHMDVLNGIVWSYYSQKPNINITDVSEPVKPPVLRSNSNVMTAKPVVPPKPEKCLTTGAINKSCIPPVVSDSRHPLASITNPSPSEPNMFFNITSMTTNETTNKPKTSESLIQSLIKEFDSLLSPKPSVKTSNESQLKTDFNTKASVKSCIENQLNTEFISQSVAKSIPNSKVDLNPRIPYFVSLPPMTKEIIICGTAPQLNKEFDFNLYVGHEVTDQLKSFGDIAFHFNPRFGIQKVVRNSLIGRKWGPEEREAISMPYSCGLKFETIISIDSSAYTVVINGNKFIDYEHRIPVSTVGVFGIGGTVDVDRVEFRSQPRSHHLYSPIFQPTVPYDHTFTNGLTEGLMIFISGRLNASADSFSILFYASNGIALHFEVMFSPKTVDRKCQFSYGQVFPVERQIPYFPFNESVFDVMIRIDKQFYDFAINGQQFCNYSHKIAFNSVNRLSITGDLSIQSIRFANH